MKTEIELDVQPFAVPLTVPANRLSVSNYISPPLHARAPWENAPFELMLSDIPAETLEKMCDEFRTKVFLEAGKRRPPRAEAK